MNRPYNRNNCRSCAGQRYGLLTLLNAKQLDLSCAVFMRFRFLSDDDFSLQSVQNFINQTWLERYDSQISEQALTLLWSTIVSIFTLGGFAGASIGGALAIRFGRY